MAEQFRNFVDGKWVPAASGATFPSLNPANKAEVLGTFPRSDHRDVDRAVESARGHFQRWRLVPVRRRAEILRRAAEALRAQEEDLARLVTREMGKVLREARAELQETIDLLLDIAGEGPRLSGTALPPEAPDRLAVWFRVPLGVVAAITPCHVPLALPAAQIARALVAGNTVVLKPAEETPLVATRVVESLVEAGVPPGALNLVHGVGEEAGAPLVRHPEVALVAFSGSRAVAREVAIACAADHKRMALHVAGKGALIVMDDADMELALAAAAEGAFATAGQRPASVGRLILHRPIARVFAERLVGGAGALRLGDGLLPATDVGPLVNEVRLKRVHAATRLAAKEGARLLCGGEAFRDGDCRRGFFYPPTVFGEVRPAMRIALEEVPGPAVSLITVCDLEEGIAVANRSRFGLTAGIYSRNVQRALLAARELRARRIAVNASPGAAEASLALPGGSHAGPQGSGGWPTALAPFLAWNSVAVDYRGNVPGEPGA